MSATNLLEIKTTSEAQTHALAKSIAQLCIIGDCILLEGDLGAGKTSFARAFIQAKTGIKDDITSPTFTLVQTYPLQDGLLYHCDLYRIKHESELEELGLEEAFSSGITLIEWPQLAKNIVPKTALAITIDIAGDSRIFSFSGQAQAWHNRLQTRKAS